MACYDGVIHVLLHCYCHFCSVPSSIQRSIIHSPFPLVCCLLRLCIYSRCSCCTWGLQHCLSTAAMSSMHLPLVVFNNDSSIKEPIATPTLIKQTLPLSISSCEELNECPTHLSVCSCLMSFWENLCTLHKQCCQKNLLLCSILHSC